MMGSVKKTESQGSGKKAKSKGQGLIDLVFSWSIDDVLNKDLYKGKVKKIPKTFLSTDDYMKSFIDPLIEETHADLLSKITTVSHAPTRKILAIDESKDFKPPKQLYYNISLKSMRDTENDIGMYEPEVGDLIALTEVRPKCIDDLNRPERPYIVALVQGRRGDNSPDRLPVRSSKPIMFHQDKKDKKKGTLFATYLTNMTTNTRIWKALNSEVKGVNMNIIQKVLQSDATVSANCTCCLSEENEECCCIKSKGCHQPF
ncbi:hypothetical protein F0562_006728 [Nyssa sinensis]|uniref:DUF6469 domain-containing protein n=1 Tax=Nyssa sinensis TaxID=561372 RepID=A0A5J5ANA2_9ASTE|nr:hypothetical protein F0562_006728 [Nyssa sinensis]